MHCCLNSGWPKHGSVNVSGGDAAMALVTFFIVAADAEQVLGPAHRTTTIQQTQQNTKKQSSLVVSVSAWRCRGSLLSLGTHPPAHACSSARFFKVGESVTCGPLATHTAEPESVLIKLLFTRCSECAMI